MNTICMTFRTHAECPLHFNVWPLVTAAVGDTHLVLVHPLNYDADRDLAEFFGRTTRIFGLLSVVHHASFADVTHDFQISSPPVPPPRSPPKIDWSSIDPPLGQSSEPIGLRMKPYNNVPHLAENMLSARGLPDIILASRVVPFDTYSACT